MRNQILISLTIIALLICLGFIFVGGPTSVIRPTSNSAPHGPLPGNSSIAVPDVMEEPGERERLPALGVSHTSPVTFHIPQGHEAVTVSVPEIRRKRGERKSVPELSQDKQTKYAHLNRPGFAGDSKA